jgi:hypothetical protein
MPIHPRGIKLILLTLGVVIAASAWGQGDMKSSTPKAPAPIRTTMEAPARVGWRTEGLEVPHASR